MEHSSVVMCPSCGGLMGLTGPDAPLMSIVNSARFAEDCVHCGKPFSGLIRRSGLGSDTKLEVFIDA